MTTYHPRITNATTAFISGAERTAELRRMLKAEQQVVRDAPRDTYNERIATANATDLEGLIARSEANDRAREQGAAERQAAAAAKHAERQASDDSKLKETIRSEFMAQVGVTEGDFERLFPTLRDQYLMKQAGEAMAQARSRLGRI